MAARTDCQLRCDLMTCPHKAPQIETAAGEPDTDAIVDQHQLAEFAKAVLQKLVKTVGNLPGG